MLVIRLIRTGKKHQPFFRVIVCDKKNPPRGGRFVEILGFFNPLTKEKNFKAERIQYWISVGAQPSDTVRNFLVKEKIMEGDKINKFKLTKKKKEEIKNKEQEAAEAKDKPKEEKKEEAPKEEVKPEEVKEETKEVKPEVKPEEEKKPEEAKEEAKPEDKKEEEVKAEETKEEAPKEEEKKEEKTETEAKEEVKPEETKKEEKTKEETPKKEEKVEK